MEASAPQFQYEYSRSAWPLSCLTFFGTPSDSDVECILEESHKDLSKCENHTLLIDARGLKALSPKQRKMIADSVGRNDGTLKGYRRGVAVIIDSALVRGIVTAIMWIKPLPMPLKIFGKPEEARSWLEKMLASSG